MNENGLSRTQLGRITSLTQSMTHRHCAASAKVSDFRLAILPFLDRGRTLEVGNVNSVALLSVVTLRSHLFRDAGNISLGSMGD